MTYYGASELARSFRIVRKNTLAIAEDIPEDQYDFRPTPECRSVREILAHIAVSSQRSYRGHAVQKITTFVGIDWPTYIRERQEQEQQLARLSKAQLIEFLRADGDAWGAYLDTRARGGAGRRHPVLPAGGAADQEPVRDAPQREGARDAPSRAVDGVRAAARPRAAPDAPAAGADGAMTTGTPASAGAITNRGWQVTFVGMGINLALGVLYSWSVISKAIPADWGWSEAGRALPYSVACLMFSLTMVPAGRLQDRFGPRVVATVGGVLVGAGLILASLTSSLSAYIVGFGVLAGAGFGAGYSATTPAAVKWFPASAHRPGDGSRRRRLRPVGRLHRAARQRAHPGARRAGDDADLRHRVPDHRGRAGPVAARAAGRLRARGLGAEGGGRRAFKADFTPGEVLRTWQFYVLWFMLACGAGAGLMVISKLVKMVEVQTGLTLGFLLVAILALGNGGGRIAGRDAVGPLRAEADAAGGVPVAGGGDPPAGGGPARQRARHAAS